MGEVVVVLTGGSSASRDEMEWARTARRAAGGGTGRRVSVLVRPRLALMSAAEPGAGAPPVLAADSVGRDRCGPRGQGAAQGKRGHVRPVSARTPRRAPARDRAAQKVGRGSKRRDAQPEAGPAGDRSV